MNLFRPASSITTEAAHAAVGAGVTKAAELEWRINVVVVDRGGNLIALLRNEDAPLLSTSLAIDKAYTALSFNMSGKDWNQVPGAPSDEVRRGIATRERLAVFGGCLPKKSGTLPGASGEIEEQDEICIRAALAFSDADML